MCVCVCVCSFVCMSVHVFVVVCHDVMTTKKQSMGIIDYKAKVGRAISEIKAGR